MCLSVLALGLAMFGFRKKMPIRSDEPLPEFFASLEAHMLSIITELNTGERRLALAKARVLGNSGLTKEPLKFGDRLFVENDCWPPTDSNAEWQASGLAKQIANIPQVKRKAEEILAHHKSQHENSVKSAPRRFPRDVRECSKWLYHAELTGNPKTFPLDPSLMVQVAERMTSEFVHPHAPARSLAARVRRTEQSTGDFLKRLRNVGIFFLLASPFIGALIFQDRLMEIDEATDGYLSLALACVGGVSGLCGMVMAGQADNLTANSEKAEAQKLKWKGYCLIYLFFLLLAVVTWARMPNDY
jgi:hypothetical protein